MKKFKFEAAGIVVGIDFLWMIGKRIKEKELRDEILGELVACGLFFELKKGYDLWDINEFLFIDISMLICFTWKAMIAMCA